MNMSNKHEIISFDSNRVWFDFLRNRKVCKKKTKIDEVESLIQASNFLKNKKIKIFDIEYNILTPELVLWNSEEGILTMSYCEGENLESIICDEERRNFGVNILQRILNFILQNRFFWRDFAPRNIIVSKNTIYFVDFEKGISDISTTYKDYLRLRVYREYSSFLLPEERKIDIEKIFELGEGEVNDTINVDMCSRRIIILAKAMGYYPTMTKKQNLYMRKKIIEVEQPYIVDGKIRYPRIFIEKLLESKNDEGYEKYARYIIKMSKEKEDGR